MLLINWMLILSLAAEVPFSGVHSEYFLRALKKVFLCTPEKLPPRCNGKGTTFGKAADYL